MKQIAILVLMLCSLQGWSQVRSETYLGTNTTRNVVRGDLRVDSLFYLPISTPTTSKVRVGAARYNVADSSIYLWTGIAWRKSSGGSGGGTPSLQAVTDAGFVTTNPLITTERLTLRRGDGTKNPYVDLRDFGDATNALGGFQLLATGAPEDGTIGTVGVIRAGSPFTANRTFILPNKSGTFAMLDDISATSAPTLNNKQVGFGSGSNLLTGTNNYTYDVSTGYLRVGGTGGEPRLQLTSGTGGGSYLEFQEGTTTNWIVGKQTTKDFGFFRYNSSGVFQGIDFKIDYATGNILFNSLKTGSTAPVTSGAVKMVVTDANGRQSFQDIPTGGGGSGSVTSVTTTDNNLKVDNTTTTPVVSTNKAVQTLTDASTITWDMSSGYNATVTLTGNRTLSITNVQSGQEGLIVVKQDATGGRTLTLPAGSQVGNGGSGVIPLSTGGAKKDLLLFYYDGVNFHWTYLLNYN